MPDSHEAVAALPSGSAADKDLLRGLIVGRLIYFLGSGEDAQDFVAIDPSTGDVPPALAQSNKIFWYDSSDTTTAHDGTTCLVSSDSKRFKYSGQNFDILSVLDKDLTAPPGGESVGDAYLVPAAATGDWSGEDEGIAIYTAQGYVFEDPRIGRRVLVEDEDVYYRYNAAGNWVEDTTLVAGAVEPSHVLHGPHFWLVANQTTDTPPGSPSDGDTYIIGSSPSGDWAGHAGKIAIAKDSAWLIVTPIEGEEAYDQAQNVKFKYSGAAWGQVTGERLNAVRRYTSSDTWSKPSGLTRVEVHVVGRGGAGGDDSGGEGGAGGGAGGESWKDIDAGDLSSSETVTIAATSSFGAHCQATSGSTGTTGGGRGGAGGVGSGGDINKTGEPGHEATGGGTSGSGGSSTLGGGGRQVVSGFAGGAAGGYGGGGAGNGGSYGGSAPSNGGAAIIIVREYVSA